MDKNPTTATVKAPASNFTGDVWMNPVFSGDGTFRLTCGLVRFTPGARTNWHSHANGQLLVRTDGVGLVGTRDGKTVVLRSGESVWTRRARCTSTAAPPRT
jgi:quercetin dioxygenase-like cupin family protein